MSAQAAESTTQVFDVVKQVISFLLIVVGIVGFYYFSNDVVLLYRVLALVAVILAAMGLFLTTEIGRNVWNFVLESKQEVRRVVWPTRDETVRTTMMVVVMVFVVGMVLWFFDSFLFWGIRYITGQV